MLSTRPRHPPEAVPRLSCQTSVPRARASALLRLELAGSHSASNPSHNSFGRTRGWLGSACSLLPPFLLSEPRAAASAAGLRRLQAPSHSGPPAAGCTLQAPAVCQLTMRTTRSVEQLTGIPDGLFEALLRGDAAAALRLLEPCSAAGAQPPAALLPVEGSSLLHAAGVGGCATAIPALVAGGGAAGRLAGGAGCRGRG